jgi:hypothetical protein
VGNLTSKVDRLEEDVRKLENEQSELQVSLGLAKVYCYYSTICLHALQGLIIHMHMVYCQAASLKEHSEANDHFTLSRLPLQRER